MEELEFEFDEGNTRHLFTDHPERYLDIVSVTSVFDDTYRLTGFDKISNRGEEEYFCYGTNNQSIVMHVIFVVRNGKIRPFHCRPASKKERKMYEDEKQKRSIR